MLKRHLRQQRTVEEYGRNMKQLAGRAQSLLSAGHPEGCVCRLKWLCRSWASGQEPHQPVSLQVQERKIETVFPNIEVSGL